MKVTRSQKISLGVLGLCVCAFVADRVFSDYGTPAHAATAPISVAPKPIGSAYTIMSDASPPASGAADLALALQRLDEESPYRSEIRDAFATPAGLAVGSDGDSSTPDERVVRFQANHHLKAIFNQVGLIQVVVDGRLINGGQSIDGFTLISVKQLSADFAADNLHAQLRLAKQDGSSLPD